MLRFLGRPIEELSSLNNQESKEEIVEESKKEIKEENKEEIKENNEESNEENKEENANTSSNIRGFYAVFLPILKTKRTKTFQSLWSQTHGKRRITCLICFKITARVLTGFMTKGLAHIRKNILKTLVLVKNRLISSGNNPNLLEYRHF